MDLQQNEKASISIALKLEAIIDLKNKILPTILSHLTTIPLPNIYEENVDLTNISMTQLSLPVDRLKIKLNDGSITASCSGLKFNLDFTAKPNLPFDIKTSVDGIAHIKDSAVSLKFRLTNGISCTKLIIDEIIVDLMDFFLVVKGPLGYIATLLANAIASLLKDQINIKIGSILNEILDEELNHLISKIEYNAEIPGTYLKVDYHLANSPIITPEYISFQFNARFFNSIKPILQVNSLSPTTCMLPKIDEKASEEHVQFFMSENVIHSLLYSLFISGYLEIKVDQSMIPPEADYTLDTSALNMVFNGVEEVFGHEEPIELIIGACEIPPTLRIKPGSFGGEITGYLKVQVLDKNIWNTALVLNTTISIEGKIAIENYIVHGSLKSLKLLDLKVKESKIPDVDPEILSDVINTIVTLSINPINERFFSSGFPLPSVPYTNLESMSAIMNDGYLKVGGTPVINEKIAELLR